MSLRREIFRTAVSVLIAGFGFGSDVDAQPVFENRTPVGFNAADSTTTSSFVTDKDVTVRVDLNEAANADFPVIGNFQKLEKSVPFYPQAQAGSAAYMSQAITIDQFGFIHRAWIQQRGLGGTQTPATTPVYGVVYAKSVDGGKTFLDTVSVSGTLRFDLITPSFLNDSGFSTVDVVVDGRGNPRVVYAMDNSPDGIGGEGVTGTSANQKYLNAGGAALNQYDNIYFNYSNDGGSSWLPANSAVVINDTATVQGRRNAFPRMAISSTDDCFIVYERQLDDEIANFEDVILAKVDADSLTGGSAQAVQIGSLGQSASRGGVRIDLDGADGRSPDIAIGDDDVLHVVWYNGGVTETIEHKTVPASLWDDVSAAGWNNGVTGDVVGTFDDDATNLGIGRIAGTVAGSSDRIFPNLNEVHVFPTVVVDRQRSPDRIYVLWKHTDSVAGAVHSDENVAYDFYSYDGAIGPGSFDGVPTFAFPTSSANAQVLLTGNAGPMFQNRLAYQIEQHWSFVDRVAAAIDDRRATQGDLHIVFSGGASNNVCCKSAAGPVAGAVTATKMFYSRFNGQEWELPQVVASAGNNAALQHDDGVSLRHMDLFEPDIAVQSGDANVYMSFVGGSPSGTGTSPHRLVAGNQLANSGRGYSAMSNADIAPLPYFKIIGRVITDQDQSTPVGGFAYNMVYNPVNPQAVSTKNMIYVIAGDNASGSGIGGATPSSSSAPGGFLTGQWQSKSAVSFGVTTLDPATSPLTFVAKGIANDVEGTNNNGVFEGQNNDSGTSGFAEWGDNGDKIGLLVKLNVLGSDSADNLFVISASTASRASASQQQNIHVQGGSVPRFARGVTASIGGYGITGVANVRVGVPPAGSYFQLGANIAIVAANTAPIVRVVAPSASTSGFANESFTIRYVLFDDDDVGTTTGASVTDSLQMELYAYPDNGLTSVLDIRTFGSLIVDENDAFTSAATAPGTGDLTESTSNTNIQDYSWDNPGLTLQSAFGFQAITKILDGTLFIYAVADDGANPPVFDVSEGPLTIRHIPLVKQITPTGTDTVDTGEFDDLAKTNPFKVEFTIADFNDNAQVRLFVSTTSTLVDSNASISAGTFPNATLELAGATPIQLSDSLRTDEDVDFEFDVTAQGAAGDSVIAQGNYFIYAVVTDGDSTVVGKSTQTLAIRHSPAFEFTAPLVGEVRKINTTQGQTQYTFQWQRGRSDVDIDDNATISLYYTGLDPTVKNFSGTDSTDLVATTGTDSGAAVLIISGLSEDDEGGGDQFVWDLANPPGVLPKVFRQNPSPVATADAINPFKYQAGASTDTAWVYAVVNDGASGNVRVSLGGAVLLVGTQESPASSAPKVTMKTPPSGGQTLINGDVIRLEYDAFLIDDGTGTDDAYLRLYAAPANKYTTLTQLEGNMNGLGTGNADVLLINSLTGADTTLAQVRTIRESDPKFFNWDTKTTSFPALAGGSTFDIFIAASSNPRFGESIVINGVLDSVATGIGSQAQRAVLSKAPGTLSVVGTDPLYSIEMGPAALTASSGDTLDFDILINSQGSSADLFSLYLDVPRNYFEVIDQDTVLAGVQPFADSTGAFQAPSSEVQNDTTQGTAQFLKLNFVEFSITGEVIGRVTTPFDSSQVAATLQLKVKQFDGGAPLDTLLQWSTESGRTTALYRGINALAAPTRDANVILTPRARLLVTVPLEGRSDYADTMDVHLREVGSTKDVTDQAYIASNDSTPVDLGGGVLEDSVNVPTNSFGTFQLIQIPPGIYELTVKAPGYVTGRTDTLNLFNGLTLPTEPTFGSDGLGDLSPATPLGFLLGGDATGDNQVDIADANLIFAVWNLTTADSGFVRDADINNDGVINSLDIGFVSTNFNRFGAPPVFKPVVGGDNAGAIARLEGMGNVEAWWPGKVFEVTASVEGMNDVTAYGMTMTYDPELVRPLEAQTVEQGDIFDENSAGSLFFQRVEPGAIEITGSRIGRGWSARGDADLVTVRFVTLGDEPGVIDIASGQLVNSNYQGVQMQVDRAPALPTIAALHQNYPNPFNPSTEIQFDIPTARDVKLRVYNQLGQTVRTLVDNRMKAGTHNLKWDGADTQGKAVASGVYFYNLEAGQFSQIRKMMLVK